MSGGLHNVAGLFNLNNAGKTHRPAGVGENAPTATTVASAFNEKERYVDLSHVSAFCAQATA